MEKLKDYSGPFKADLKFEDLSKDFLIRLMREWMTDYLQLNFNWAKEVRKITDADTLIEVERKVWEAQGDFVLPRIAKAANIQLPVKNMYEAVKPFQIIPDNITYQDLQAATMDFLNDNHVRITTTKCTVMEWCEDRSSPERVRDACLLVDVPCGIAYYKALNPNIEVETPVLPPRKSKDDICCVWEVKLEPKP